MTLRIGSLFSGYGGLEIGIGQVLDAVPVWHSEIEPGPSQILERHWPTVPNLGDVTAVDWSTVAPVDVLCGGFPCQDVSLAGLRRGLHPDTRSGLWSHFAAGIDALRPDLVVIENVRGLLSAEAHSDLEPDAWDLGGPSRGDGPTLRALGAVLGDLADLGYDAEWHGVRAADAGAPHGRFRVFVLARPARDAVERGRVESPARAAGASAVEARGSDRAPQDADVATRGERRESAPGAPEGGRARADARGRDRAPASDPRDHGRGAGAAALDDDGAGAPRDEPDRRAPAAPAPVDWGAYGPAVRRWEGVLGRVAPAPTTTSALGGQRLSAAFVEWMMGLPAGHVTAPEVGLARKEQLKALGNGVVPQQAALALRMLLGAP